MAAVPENVRWLQTMHNTGIACESSRIRPQFFVERWGNIGAGVRGGSGASERDAAVTYTATRPRP